MIIAEQIFLSANYIQSLRKPAESRKSTSCMVGMEYNTLIGVRVERFRIQ